MSNGIAIESDSASPRRGRLTKLQKQYFFVVAVLFIAGCLLTRPQSVKISGVSRHEGSAAIVWNCYDTEPKFVLIYGESRDAKDTLITDGVLAGTAYNSRGELTCKLQAADGTIVDVVGGASGPIMIAGKEYDPSRGRTFTIDLQRDGAVMQHDVVIPLPPEPAEDHPPYRFDVANDAVMQFVRAAQETK